MLICSIAISDYNKYKYINTKINNKYESKISIFF